MKTLKQLHPQVKEVATGTVTLASGADASLVKRALFCRTGTFDGMFGAVTVTPELLAGIAERYNRVKAKAQNANDFAPILTDHAREVDRIKGRILPGLELGEWTDPNTGVSEIGLYGDLRIDDQDAQAKVGSGQYAHLSISFDETTFELFEISFVAIEAAKGSIILSQKKKSEGGRMNLDKKVAALSKRNQSLAQAVRTGLATRATSLKAAQATMKSAGEEAKALQAGISALTQKMKAGQLKGQFSKFVLSGKMNPAELKGLDFAAISKMDDAGLTVLLSAFESRPVSKDLVQFGQRSEPISAKAMSTEELRKAIKLQQSQKNRRSLAEEDKGKENDEEKKMGEESKDNENLNEGEEKKEDKPFSMGADEWKSCMDEINGMHAKLAGVIEKLTAAQGETEKLAESDKEEEKKLEADKGDDEDLAAGDDEEKEKQSKEEDKK